MMRPAFLSHPLMDYFKRCSGLLFLLFLILMSTSRSGAQSFNPGNITIEKGGKIWIEGDAGMISYQCSAKELSGVGSINNTENPQNTIKGQDGDVAISVSLPVKALKCGKRAMDKDMYEALKYEQFPTIKYKLLDAKLAESNQDTTGWMDIRTRGIMEIAGVQDTTSFIIQGKLLSENRFNVKGTQQINMDTYNIDPPSAMFGLIRADKKLSINFDVTVKLKGQQTK